MLHFMRMFFQIPDRVGREFACIIFSAVSATSCLNASPAVQPGVELTQNITYGNAGGQELLLDLAKPKSGKGPFPAIVIVHGRGWSSGSRVDYLPVMLPLSAARYVCITVDYRLLPKHRFPDQIENVKCAVRWLRTNAEKHNVDPDRNGAIGGSAGAHLTALLGTTGQIDAWNQSGGSLGHSSAIRMMICQGLPADLRMGHDHADRQPEAEGAAVRGLLQALLPPRR